MNFGEAPVLITVYTCRVERLEHGRGGGECLKVIHVGFQVLVEVILIHELSVTGPDVGHPVAVVRASLARQVGASATPVYWWEEVLDLQYFNVKPVMRINFSSSTVHRDVYLTCTRSQHILRPYYSTFIVLS